MPVTAGIVEDRSEDEEEACFEDSLHPRTQHESTRAAAHPGAGLTTLRHGSDGIRQDSVMYSDPAGPQKGQHHCSTSHHLDVGTVRYADSCAPPPDVDRQAVKGRNRHSKLMLPFSCIVIDRPTAGVCITRPSRVMLFVTSGFCWTVNSHLNIT